METKIYLGLYKGKKVYLYKHSWNCDWYWGLGYVGNSHWHFHFDTFLECPHTASELFTDSNFTDKAWWIIRDLFVQAYALKKVAEVYRYGGYQKTEKGITDILKSDDKAKQANEDLELILNTLWGFMLDNNLGK